MDNKAKQIVCIRSCIAKGVIDNERCQIETKQELTFVRRIKGRFIYEIKGHEVILTEEQLKNNFGRYRDV